MGLSGRVAVLAVDPAAAARAPELARRLAAHGARVVLVTGGDGDEAGRLAAAVEATGSARPAVFRLDDAGDADDGGDRRRPEAASGDVAALVEFLEEVFRPAP